MLRTMTYANERQIAEALARQAGELLLRHRAAGFAVNYKTSKDDPVTVADTEASELIVAGLRAAFPDDGILSEELTDTAERLGKRRVWIIDPIDGTQEYVDGTPDFAVSIGLAVDGEAVLGVVDAPARQAIYSGTVESGRVGEGLTRNGVRAGFSARPPAESLIAVSDTEHKRELHRYPLPQMLPSGSIALKLALIAAGEADATFTMSPRSEWDIAAGMALIQAAGGRVTRRGGGRISLNSPEPVIRQGLIGGRPDVVAWLEGELFRLAIPEQQLGLVDTDEAWALLGQVDQARLRGEPHLHIRHAAGKVVALVLLDDDLRVRRSEGDALHLGVLTRDLTRAYGALQGA